MITPLLDITGGWYPRFSPDGARVCFGSGKLGYALVVKNALPNWAISTGAYPGGWFDARTIYFLRVIGQQSDLYAYDVTATSLPQRLVQAGIAGNTFDVTFDHWATARHGIGRLTWDNEILAEPGRQGVSVWEDHVVTAVNPGREQPRWPFEHWINGTRVRTFTPTKGRTNEFRLGEDGWIGFAYNSPAWAASPSDPPEYRDLSIVPAASPYFVSGEGAPVIFARGDDLWALTSAEVDGSVFMALRRLDDLSRYIRIPWGAVRPVAHVEPSGAILVAGNVAEGGRLKVFRVDPETGPWTPARQLPLRPHPLAPYPRPMHYGYFFEKSARYGSEQAPSNCTVIVEPGLRAASAGEDVVISRITDTGSDGIQEWAPEWHRVAAVIVAAEVQNKPEALQAEVTAARERMQALGLSRREVVTYSSTNYWPQVDADVLGIECYPGRDEPLSNAAARFHAAFAKAAADSREVALVTADYDRGYLTEDTLRRAQWIYDALARQYQPKYWLRFSHGRAGGVRDHRVLEPWHADVARAVTAPSITVLPWPDPPDPPKPEPPKPGPPMTTKTLKAFTGKYVCAELGGYLIADRDEARGWETFKFWPVGATYVIQTDHGSYLTADIDGTFRFSTQYPSPDKTDTWEKFTLEGGEGGGLAIRTYHGTLMTVNDDQSVTHKHRPNAGINETFNLSSGGNGGGGTGPSFLGPLRAEEKRLVQRTGEPFLYRAVTDFRLLHMLETGEDIAPVLDERQGLGFNTVRVLTTAEFLFDLRPDRGRARIPELLRRLEDKGMGAEIVALADTKNWSKDQLRRHLEETYSICSAHPNVLVEGGNEIGPIHQTQHALVAEVCRAFRPSRGGTPYCPGSVHGAELCKERSALTQAQWDTGQAEDKWPYWDEVHTYVWTYGASHLQRRDDRPNRVRRTRELELSQAESHVYFLDDEPMGADEVYRPGKRDNNPSAFFAQGVNSRIFTVGSCFHSEDGLRSRMFQPVQKRCAEAFIRGCRIVPDTQTLTFKNTGWHDSPVESFVGATRAYSGVSGGTGILHVHGIEAGFSARMKNGWRIVGERDREGEFVVYDLAQG